MCGLREAAARFSLLLSQSEIHGRYVFDEHAFDIAPSSAQEECGGLAGDPGDVRSEEGTARGVTFEMKQRIVGRGRLAGINIDGRAAEMAGVQRVRERRFI